MTIFEAPWFSLDATEFPTVTGGSVPVDTLDARLEELVRQVPGFKLKDVYNWVGPLPGGDYVHPERGLISAAEAQALLAAGVIQLPGRWWEFAVGTYRGKITKASVRPRVEQGELHQTEIDRQSSFGDRLTHAFA